MSKVSAALSLFLVLLCLAAGTAVRAQAAPAAPTEADHLRGAYGPYLFSPGI